MFWETIIFDWVRYMTYIFLNHRDYPLLLPTNRIKTFRMVEYSVDHLNISLKCSYYFIHYICINVMACIRNNIIIQMIYWLKIMPTDLKSIFRTNTSRLLKVKITDNVVLFCLYSILYSFHFDYDFSKPFYSDTYFQNKEIKQIMCSYFGILKYLKFILYIQFERFWD